MPVQDLDSYQLPDSWRCGSPIQRILWIPFARPLVASWIPGTFWRQIFLRLFGATIGLGGRIKPRVRITAPWNLTVGDHCWKQILGRPWLTAPVARLGIAGP